MDTATQNIGDGAQKVADATTGQIVGIEHWVESKSAHDGSQLRIHVWEKHRAELDPAELAASGRVVVLAHGSRRSGRVAFDLQVPLEPGEPSYSLMDVLAHAGFDVFSVDVQNYGRSDHHPSGLKVTTEVAANDVRNAVEYICDLRSAEDVLLLGWSWGSTVVSLYAESPGHRVRRLIQFGPKVIALPAGSGGPVDVPLDQQFFETTVTTSEQSFQAEYGDRKVVEAWWEEGRKWDRFGPNGCAADFITRFPLSKPERLTVPTLIILAGGDFMWFDKDHIAKYFVEIAATEKHLSLLPDGGHAAHLHRGRAQFFKRVIDFFEAGADDP